MSRTVADAADLLWQCQLLCLVLLVCLELFFCSNSNKKRLESKCFFHRFALFLSRQKMLNQAEAEKENQLMVACAAITFKPIKNFQVQFCRLGQFTPGPGWSAALIYYVPLLLFLHLFLQLFHVRSLLFDFLLLLLEPLLAFLSAERLVIDGFRRLLASSFCSQPWTPGCNLVILAVSSDKTAQRSSCAMGDNVPSKTISKIFLWFFELTDYRRKHSYIQWDTNPPNQHPFFYNASALLQCYFATACVLLLSNSGLSDYITVICCEIAKVHEWV